MESILNKTSFWAEKYFKSSKRSLLNVFLFSLATVIVSRLILALIGVIYNPEMDFIYHSTSYGDSNWYSKVIVDGYQTEPSGHPAGDAASWAFFPLDVMLIRAFTLNGLLDFRISGVLVNSCLFVLALVQSHRYIMLTRNDVNLSVIFILLMCFGPYNFYFSTLYTESMFFLLCVTSLLEMRQKHYIRMGISGMLLSACRVTGVFIVFCVLIFILKEHFSNKEERFTDFLKSTLTNSRLIIGVCMVPAGLFAYMLYLYNLTGDSLAFMHIQKAWRSGTGEGIIKNFCNALVSESFVDVFYAFYLVIILIVAIYTIKRCPSEIVMYVLPLIITVLTTPNYLGVARYSIGTGVFVISFVEMLKKHLSKSAQLVIYFLLFLLSNVVTLSWYMGRPITI